MADEPVFPDMHAESIRARFKQGKALSVLAFIGEFESLEERKALYGLAQRTIGRADVVDLDALTEVVNHGIMECIAACENTDGDEQTANIWKDAANVFSYNLSADLAECWPSDNTPREPRHFLAGLTAAANCLKWRNELRKGSWSFSIAWWAQGAHQLSLAKADEAVDSFRQSLHCARVLLKEKEEDLDPERDFGCVLGNGYLGLAREAAGDGEGKAQFDEACLMFRALIPEGGEIGEDADFGLKQIETMRARLAARGIVSAI